MGVCYVTVPTIIHLPNPHPCDLDLHTRNLAFTLPSLQALQEEDFLHKLGRPETAPIHRTDNQPLESSLPRYLVRPTSYHQEIETSIKIIDFGQSFLRNEPPPDTLHTPFPYRAPEIIFQDKLDYRVDLWSMACLVRFLSYTSQGVVSRVYPHGVFVFHSRINNPSSSNSSPPKLSSTTWCLHPPF